MLWSRLRIPHTDLDRSFSATKSCKVWKAELLHLSMCNTPIDAPGVVALSLPIDARWLHNPRPIPRSPAWRCRKKGPKMISMQASQIRGKPGALGKILLQTYIRSQNKRWSRQIQQHSSYGQSWGQKVKISAYRKGILYSVSTTPGACTELKQPVSSTEQG